MVKIDLGSILPVTVEAGCSCMAKVNGSNTHTPPDAVLKYWNFRETIHMSQAEYEAELATHVSKWPT
ncbi:MAG TPA: hypothetical protein VEA59_06180 [Patescibacteria group bacterium]|nr:hypothetical protein [Patescibacteria group bacterium]